MKKQLLTISLFSLLTFSAYAQKGISVIPKLGASISHMHTGNATGASVSIGGYGVSAKNISTAGFTGGAAFSIGLSDHFSFQPELLYVRKGFGTSSTALGSSSQNTSKISYLEIPLLARPTYVKDKFMLYGLIGPSLAFALGGKYTSSIVAGGSSAAGTGKIHFSNKPAGYNGSDMYYSSTDVNRVDIGLQIGGGVGYGIGPGTALLDIRYGIGFVNFYKPAYYGSTSSLYNNISNYRVLSITLCYAIPLNK